MNDVAYDYVGEMVPTPLVLHRLEDSRLPEKRAILYQSAQIPES
jgi:hypothetical protein